MFTLFSSLFLGGVLFKEAVEKTEAENFVKMQEKRRQEDIATHNYNLYWQRIFHTIYVKMHRVLKDPNKKYEGDLFNDTETCYGETDENGKYHSFSSYEMLDKAIKDFKLQGYDWDHQDMCSNKLSNLY